MSRSLRSVLLVSLAFVACGDRTQPPASASGESDAGASIDASPVASDASPPAIDAGPPRDPFGITEIHPTAPHGREWFMDESDPIGDGVLVASTASGDPIVRNADGSWRSNDQNGTEHEGTRLEVTTPPGTARWKNVEITGHVRLVAHQFAEAFSWYGRSGVHSSSVPCDGTAYHAQLTYDGGAWFDKEVWHTGGYTNRRGEVASVTSPLVGRWVGFKAVIYEDTAATRVVVESWVDGDATDTWTLAARIEDSGGWAGGQASCGRAIDDVLVGAYPIVAFRADNAKFDFRHLSVREIATPLP